VTADRPERATIDVAHEARLIRWTATDRDGVAALSDPTTVRWGEAPSGPTRLVVGAGHPLRVAILCGADVAAERALRTALLAAGAELVAVRTARETAAFTEQADALRAGRPDLVIAHVADHRRDGDGVETLVEALRYGCREVGPAPRLLVAGDPRATQRLRAAGGGLAVEILPDPRRPDGRSALVRRIRDLRRGTDQALVLRDEAIEEVARLLASRDGAPALVVDVAGGSTSLAHATASGLVTAAHAPGLGCGSGADRVVARAGLDAVRRWIPWAVDAPTLLERVFNRARWPDAVAADRLGLILVLALAHEAIGHVLAEADALGIGAALRAARTVALCGTVARVPRASQGVLLAADALGLTGASSLSRDDDDALVAIGGLAARMRAMDGGDPDRVLAAATARAAVPLAFLVPAAPSRKGRVTVNGADGFTDAALDRGALFSLPATGPVEVRLPGIAALVRGVAGSHGVVVDVRGRPVALPPRDAERVPTVARWYAALDALAPEPAP
jgi:hypothetical protein